MASPTIPLLPLFPGHRNYLVPGHNLLGQAPFGASNSVDSQSHTMEIGDMKPLESIAGSVITKSIVPSMTGYSYAACSVSFVNQPHFQKAASNPPMVLSRAEDDQCQHVFLCLFLPKCAMKSWKHPGWQMLFVSPRVCHCFAEQLWNSQSVGGKLCKAQLVAPVEALAFGVIKSGHQRCGSAT